jgi:hypothetical protein
MKARPSERRAVSLAIDIAVDVAPSGCLRESRMNAFFHQLIRATGN